MRKEWKSFIVILLMFLTCISGVSAANEVIINNQDVGLALSFIPFESVELNQAFNLSIEVFNKSTGVGVSNAICELLIFDHGGQTILNENLTFLGGNTYNLFITGANLSQRGTFSYIINCEDQAHLFGGAVSGTFEVTGTGYLADEAEVKIYGFLFVCFLLLLALSIVIAVFVPFSNQIEITDKFFAVTKVTFSKYIKVFGIWLSFGSYMMLLTLLTGLTQNYIKFPEMRTLMTNIYTWSYFLNYGVTVAILILVFILIWKDILFNKDIINGGKSIVKEFDR